MSGKIICVALVLAMALSVGAFAGEPVPEAPVAEPAPEAYDMFDQLKRVEAAGIVFKFGGEARVRYEHWSGYDIDEYQPRNGGADGRGGAADGFISSRIRLNVEAQVSEQFVVFVEGMDARVWSYDDGPFMRFGTVYPARRYYQGEDHMDLHQAYVVVQNLAGLPLVFKLGRQEISLGGGRLLGKQSWRNDPQTFDAAVMLVPLDPVTIAVWAGKAVLFPKRSSYNHVLSQFDYYGIYTMWKVPGTDAFDIYYMHLRDDRNPFARLGFGGEQDIKIHAVGVRAAGTVAENVHWGVEYVREFGDVGPLNLRAWALHTELGYTLAGLPWTPSITGEYNHATGDNKGLLGDGQLNTFFTWFPNYHGMFGIMDMFQWSNIQHYKLGCKMHPHERITFEVAGHIFYLDESADSWYTGRTHVPAPLGGSATASRAGVGSDRNRVGEEIDVVLTLDVNEHCTIEAGYAHFFDAGYIDDTQSAVGGTGVADFAYVMTTFRF